MSDFIPGRELNRRFHDEVVRPILLRRFPQLRYSAALIGSGSDVLGYDSPRSTDHGWGPRLSLFLEENAYEKLSGPISAALSEELPPTFAGYPTNFSNSDREGTRVSEVGAAGSINHYIHVYTTSAFVRAALGIDLSSTLRPTDWLLMPEQQLLEVTSGAVYHDGLGELTKMRTQLAYYPEQVWFYLLAAAWTRIAQEEPFVARCGEAGDELGSKIIAGRLARDVMRLCFIMERRYAPYSKWLGAAFSRLSCAAELSPILESVLDSKSCDEREQHLCAAYEAAARIHNALGIADPLEATVRQFHERPYHVLDAERFATIALNLITDTEMRHIQDAVGPIGAIDQFADNTNLLGRADLCQRLRSVFEQ